MTIEANFYIFLFESFSVLARREQVHQTGSEPYISSVFFL